MSLQLLKVNRIVSNGKATISTISLIKDNHSTEFICFGLEDEYRKEKVMDETRIPAGVYKVGVRTFGGFHTRYKNKFSFHQGMLEVLNVPNFTDVLIHIGNYEYNTSGCLLTGLGAMVDSELTLQQSTKAYTTLYNKVISAALNGNLVIEFIDNDK